MQTPKFIRPAGGFAVNIAPDIQCYINEECRDNSAIIHLWESLLARIKVTALREGEEIKPGVWSFVSRGSASRRIPSIQVTFTHDMKSLSITNAKVWEPEYDDDLENGS